MQNKYLQSIQRCEKT